MRSFSGVMIFPRAVVVLGIGGEDEEDVEREAERIALNLNVAFLHDVEEADLNFSGEVGELIDGKDAAIGSRKKAVVDGEFIGEVAAAAGRPDGIDIADDVGHGYVGRSELFDKAILAGIQEMGVLSPSRRSFRGRHGRWVSGDRR